MSRPPIDLNPGSSPLALFGSEVRRHRERVGWTQEHLGNRIGYEGSYVGNVERGERRCDRKFAVKADVAMETLDALANLWDKTIKNNVFPSWFDWPAYEVQANVLRSFQLSVVPGLLQTPEYARTLLRGDEAEARLARQSILTRETPAPPLLICVLDESVLCREIGNRDVMYDQLKHLVTMVSDQIHVHVVPLEGHDGISGSFVLATLDDRSEVAYMDTAALGLTVGEPKHLKKMTESFERIRSQALPVKQSIDLITRTAEERWT